MIQRQDWLMGQIKAMADALAMILFGKAELAYEIQDEASHTETDTLFLRLVELIDRGHINDAEDLLFKELNPSDTRYLLLAVDFYQRLNAKTDEALENSDFSREEVEEGLNMIMKKFGVQLGLHTDGGSA